MPLDRDHGLQESGCSPRPVASWALRVSLPVFKVRPLIRRSLPVRPDGFAALDASEVWIVEPATNRIVPKFEGFGDPALPAVQHTFCGHRHR